MTLRAICQRCGEREHQWNVHQATFDVREIKRWALQLCDRCSVHVEMVLRAALESPRTVPAVESAVESGQG